MAAQVGDQRICRCPGLAGEVGALVRILCQVERLDETVLMVDDEFVRPVHDGGLGIRAAGVNLPLKKSVRVGRDAPAESVGQREWPSNGDGDVRPTHSRTVGAMSTRDTGTDSLPDATPGPHTMRGTCSSFLPHRVAMQEAAMLEQFLAVIRREDDHALLKQSPVSESVPGARPVAHPHRRSLHRRRRPRTPCLAVRDRDSVVECRGRPRPAA